MHNVMRFRTKFLSGHWFVEIILPGLNLYQIYFIVLYFHDVIFIMQLTRNYAETALFHKISTPGNQVKLRYFSQCLILRQSEAVFRVYRYLHMLFPTYQITMFSENTQHFFNVSIYFFSFTLDSLTYFKQMFPFHTL